MSEHAFIAGGVGSRRLTGRAAGSTAANPLSALAVAALCVLGLAAIWSVAELVPAAHLKDAVALYDFTMLSRPQVDSLANFLLHLLDPSLFILWAVALVAIAFARDRPRVAVAVLAVLALAPLTAEDAQAAARPPARQRRLRADQRGLLAERTLDCGDGARAVRGAGGACQAAHARGVPGRAVRRSPSACPLLILAWHMPSDVLGGYLVATLWMALAVAGLRTAERLRPTRRPARARSRPSRPRPPRRVSRGLAGSARGPAPWAPGSHSGSVRCPSPPSRWLRG